MTNARIQLLLVAVVLLTAWTVIASLAYAVVSRVKSCQWIKDHLKLYSVVLGGLLAPALLSGGHAGFPVPGGAGFLGVFALFAFGSDGLRLFLINSVSWLVVSVLVYFFTSSRLKRDVLPTGE